MNTYVLLMMGGIGTRYGSDLPKQFTNIDGRPLFTYIANKLSTQTNICGIVLVVNNDWVEFTQIWAERLKIKKIISIIPGGASRSDSVLCGLSALRQYACDNDIVLIHDATHPYYDEEGTRKVIALAEQFGAATLVSRIFDTTYYTDEGGDVISVVPREHLAIGASPEGFEFGKIYNLFKNTPKDKLHNITSAGALFKENGLSLKTVPTSVFNIKITSKEDMIIYQAIHNNTWNNDKRK